MAKSSYYTPRCMAFKAAFKGCPIFTKEHPQQQWVFGYYESFNRALNRAVAITKARKYPKPIEIW